MKAYNGKQELKDQLVMLAKQHINLDQYIKGTYFTEDKGCAVGCTIEDYNKLFDSAINHSDHLALANALDIPVFLTRMQDDIFEGCSNEVRKNWPVDFLEAIQVGADYSLVLPSFLLFVLKDIECDNVKNVLNDWLEKGKPDREKAQSARSDAAAVYAAAAAAAVYAAADADAAARSAIYAAARSTTYADADDDAARSATYAAARSVTYAIYAARSATYADAAVADARSKCYDSYAKELIRLLG